MISLKWIGQGGYILTNGNFSFAIDPYLSNSCEFDRIEKILIEPKDLKCEMIISTHDHRDHLDPETIGCVDKNKLFVGPSSCCRHFESLGIDKDNIIEFNRYDSFEKGGFKFTAVYAEHTEDSIGVLVECDNLKIYFSGDTLITNKIDVKCDIIVICINGKLGNMSVKEAAAITVKCGAKMAIPSHYGMFRENTEDPKKFAEHLKYTKIDTLIMEYGEVIQIK